MDGVRRAQAAVAQYYYYSPVYDALIPLRSFASVVRPGVIAAINHPRGSDEAELLSAVYLSLKRPGLPGAASVYSLD